MAFAGMLYTEMEEEVEFFWVWEYGDQVIAKRRSAIRVVVTKTK